MTFKKVIKIMKDNGWYEVRNNGGSHRQYGHPDYNYVVTVPNWGSKDLSKGVINNIRKGTGLSEIR